MDQEKDKPTALSHSGTASSLTRKHSVSVGGLHARLRNPVAVKAADPLTRQNRLALMLDVSGSMSGQKIVSLRDACTGFVNACNFGDTALAIEPFGEEPVVNRLPLSTQQMLLMTTVQMLQSTGGTPMAQALDYCINSYSITRGVLVSDGEPDSEQAAYDIAQYYKEAEIPVDCVHIGNSTHGEQCLRKIAEMTGGQYIKFTDITSFSRSFKYLSPAFYGILTAGGVTAAQLGATELK